MNSPGGRAIRATEEECAPRDFQHLLKQARGSVNEVETQLLLAKDLGYLQENQAALPARQCEELGKVLNGLISGLRKTEDLAP